MTEEQRLEKNSRIRKKGKETREKRKSQVCRVYRVKIDISHLNSVQKERLKMLFVEAKWLYNDALTFINDHSINEYDSRIITVHGLDKNRQPVTHDLQFISSQMRQSVVNDIKYSLKTLLSLKKKNHKTGKLHYKSDYRSINLQQYRTTYRFYDENHVGIQGFKERLKIKGAKQFWNISGIEFANAKLLNLPDGYYLAITTYQNKGGDRRKFEWLAQIIREDSSAFNFGAGEVQTDEQRTGNSSSKVNANDKILSKLRKTQEGHEVIRANIRMHMRLSRRP